MPTNMISARRSYGESISILAGSDHVAFRNVHLDLAALNADADGKKWLPAGTFLQEPYSFTPAGAPSPVQVTVVPFAKVRATSAGNTIDLGEGGMFFLPGMQVTVPGAGYNNITLTGAVAAGDTVTFTLSSGVTAAATAVTGDTLATLAARLTTAINNNPSISRYVDAWADTAGEIHMVYNTDRAFASSIAETGAGLTATLLNPDKLQDYAIGTVQSVSPAGVVTFTAAPTQVLPVGFTVSRPFDPSTLRGLTVTEVVYEYPQTEIEPITANSNDVAAYHVATLHRARMPYWSVYYSVFLPELKFYPQ